MKQIEAYAALTASPAPEEMRRIDALERHEKHDWY